MKKFIVAALLGLTVLVSSPAIAAPTAAELITQAQATLATDPAKAATILQQVAAEAGSLTAEQGKTVADLLTQIQAWANKSCATNTNVDACSSVYTSMLTIAGSPTVTGASPELYASILTDAQKFTNDAPDGNDKVAELETFLQLALGTPTPNTNATRQQQPTAD